MNEQSSFSLEQLQRWMQSFLVRPADPVLRAQHGEVSPGEVEALILPSTRMTARQRVGIYQRGYYARLLECMSKQFSVLKQALGEDLFRDFAYEYLQLYPSASYTLGNLGARFPAFLEATRPDKDAPPKERKSWPDFMIELAQLEWACFKLMEGGDGGTAIFRLQFPSYPYYQATLYGREVDFPMPQVNYLLLASRHNRIGAFALTEQEYALWEILKNGESIKEKPKGKAFAKKWAALGFEVA